MQSDNNNIDKLVQDAFATAEVDTSKQLQHWKQMQAMLQPAVQPVVKPSRIKMALWIAALLICGVFGVLVWQNTGVKEKMAVAGNIHAGLPDAKILAGNILMPNTDATAPLRKDFIVSFEPPNFDFTNFATFSSQPFTINFIACDTPAKKTTPEAPLTVETFYDKISKPVQEFEIDAEKGGTITGEEGSVIVVPPMAFGNTKGKIILKLEEYYKYSDIIAANLNTISNGQQLVTGGMVKLTAWQNDRQLQLYNGAAVNLQMPTNNFDPEMQLFLGDESKRQSNYFNTEELVTAYRSPNAYNRKLNWNLANRLYNYDWAAFDNKTNFADIFTEEPEFSTTLFGKQVLKCRVPADNPLTKAELKEYLKERYPNWSKIKVKKVRNNDADYTTDATTKKRVIKDSVRLTLAQAIKWKFIDKKNSDFYAAKITADSISYCRRYAFTNLTFQYNPLLNVYYGKIAPKLKKTISDRQVIDSGYQQIKNNPDSLQKIYVERAAAQQQYNFTIPSIGWINCDRFYNYSDKADFVIDLPKDADAGKFVTQLVFTKIRSVMQGNYSDNAIGFFNIPVNMDVVLVGLGERNGKVVSFMQPLKTSSSAVSVTELEETTPEKFKEKLKQFDF